MGAIDLYKTASAKGSEAISMPPKWLGMYSDFITKNASAVSQIESALRSLTYIIPGKTGKYVLRSLYLAPHIPQYRILAAVTPASPLVHH